MFRNRTIAISLAVAIAPTVLAQADARAVIEQAAAAHGGLETLAKYPAARIKVKGTYVLQGKEVPYSGESVYQLPDRVRSAVELTVQGIPRSSVLIQNGDKSAMIAGGLSQHIADAQVEELRLSVYCQNVARLVPLVKDSKYVLTSLDEKRIEDKPAMGVRVASPGHKDVTLYFDATSHLLVSMERPGFDSNGAKVERRELYSDYHTANGLKYAGKTRVMQNGKVTLQSEVVQFQPLERVDPKEFALPQ